MNGDQGSREARALIRLAEFGEEIERLRKERDEARNTARWLYQHGMATLIEGASGNEWIKEQIK